MHVYAVSYDLNHPGQNYAALIEELKTSHSWWHYLRSSWLIATAETPKQLWARLAPHVDKGDHVLIIEVVDHKSGWLPPKAWDWINRYLAAAA